MSAAPKKPAPSATSQPARRKASARRRLAATTPAGLVVPMRVEALLLSESDAQQYPYFVPAVANFADLPYKGSTGKPQPYLSDSVLNSPFQRTSLPAGVHLHWHLPRALRQGQAGPTGELEMPAVPDRWLVTRVLSRAGQPLATRSWVVESSYLSKTKTYSPTSIPVNYTRTEPQPYRYLGRVYDYTEWVATGEQGPAYYEGLTALGYGLPDFATCYPNCRHVFTLHDAELGAPGSFDPATDTLHYLVSGWYADPTADLLAAHPLAEADNELGWQFAGPPPTFTLLHGCARALPWTTNPNYRYLAGSQGKLGPQLALGNTAAEAIAALAARAQVARAPHIERLLNVFQDGALHRLNEPGGLAKAEEELFNNQFSALPGGEQWEVQPRPAPDSAQAVPPSPLGPVLTQRLVVLNRQQQATDSLLEQVTALRARLYADWNKLLHLEAETSPDFSRVFEYLNRELAALDSGQGTGLLPQLAKAQDEIKALRDDLADRLPPDLELVSRPAARYFQPNDPVVVLAGAGIGAPPPDQAAGAACVPVAKLLSRLDLPADLVPGSAAQALPADWLPDLPPAPGLPPDLHAALVAAGRASLLSLPELAPALADLLAARGEAGNPAALDRAATSAALAEAQQARLADLAVPAGIAFNGAPVQPTIAYRPWALPWQPQSLRWHVHYYPLLTPGKAGSPGYTTDALRQLTFDLSNFDYRYPADARFADQVYQYRGSTPLSSQAAVGLRTALARRADGTARSGPAPEPPPMLAQALSGFHAALLMQKPTMQLPVANPLASSRLYADFAKAMAAAVHNQNQYTPEFHQLYQPLRAGRMALAELWLVDSFGRYREVSLANVVVSETLPIVPDRPADQPPLLALPPRLSQPAQLRFRWVLPGSTAALPAAPGVNPISGWLVPNYLDRSLLCYDPAGQALGALVAANGGQRLYWASAPGTPPEFRDIRRALPGAEDNLLRQFILTAYERGGAYVDALLRTFDQTRTRVLPAGSPGTGSTGLLTGPPLALMQASLDLELHGLPAPDQSFAALLRDASQADPLARTTHGLPDLELPVLLGNYDELNDGLYGYFRAAPSRQPGFYDFGTFYAPAAVEGAHPGLRTPAVEPLTVRAGAAPVSLALLLDPHAAVHAYSGLLPVKSISVPPPLYTDALAQLRVTFLTAPVLQAGPGLSLPLPTDDTGGEWQWVERQPEGQWRVAAISNPTQQATLQNASAIAEGWLQLSAAPPTGRRAAGTTTD